jgi:hypothetical protein
VPNKVESIGEETQLFKSVWETHPLPKVRKNVISAIEALLARGGTQKLIIEVKKPMKLLRRIPIEEGEDAQDSVDIESDDVVEAAVACPMDEALYKPEMTPIEYVFRAIEMMGTRTEEEGRIRLTPRFILVNDLDAFSKWMNLPVRKSFFGLEVLRTKNISDDGILLVAVNENDREEIRRSLKLNIELPRKKA